VTAIAVIASEAKQSSFLSARDAPAQIEMKRLRLIEKLKIQSREQLVALARQLAAWPARPGSGKNRKQGRRS